MIFIGGVNNKNIEIDTIDPMMCKHCRETHTMKFNKSYYFFHFFFIPLWKWKLTYYVTCTGCQTIMTIPLEKGKEIEQNGDIHLTLWDLEVINEGEEPQNKCRHCHEKMAKTYQYCPHCGEKV